MAKYCLDSILKCRTGVQNDPYNVFFLNPVVLKIANSHILKHLVELLSSCIKSWISKVSALVFHYIWLLK